MPVIKDKVTGKIYAKTPSEIAREFSCHPGTIARYLKHKGSPKFTPKRGYDLSEVQEFILKYHKPNHRLVAAMEAVLGNGSDEKPTALHDDDPAGIKALSYRQRIERARAVKLETEVAIMKSELFYGELFDKWFGDAIPTMLNEIRRQCENVLPAIQEGMNASDIRRTYREHMDKVFARFESRAEEFREQVKTVKQKVRKSKRSSEDDES